MSTSPKLKLKDPWRYTCPECGSHAITSVNNKYNAKNIEHNYRCGTCSYKFNKPYDKKTKELAK